MRINYLLSAVLSFLAVSYTTVFSNDQEQVIFNDNQVNNYYLEFYTPNWADSLVHYINDSDEVYMAARLIYRPAGAETPTVLDSIGVRYKGNSSYELSADSPKRPLKFKFNEFRKGVKFFGQKKLNFSNFIRDPSFMREKIAYTIVGNYLPVPRTSYANIYIHDTLIGLYMQVEQIDEDFLKRFFKENNGNLFKAGDDGASLQYKDDQIASYSKELVLKTNEDKNDYASLIKMLYQLNNVESPQNVTAVAEYVNLDFAARHLAFTMVLSHFDSYTRSGRNFYLYEDPSSKKFHILPWDLDLSFGIYLDGWSAFSQSVVDIPALTRRPLNKVIMQNDSLLMMYYKYLSDMINGIANITSVDTMIQAIKKLIEPHVQADKNKFFSYDDFITNLDNDISVTEDVGVRNVPGVKKFVRTRTEFIKQELSEHLSISQVNKHQQLSTGNLYINNRGSDILINYRVDHNNAAVSVQIFDNAGRVVISFNPHVYVKGSHTISVPQSSLSSGVFVAVIKNGKSVHSAKFAKY